MNHFRLMTFNDAVVVGKRGMDFGIGILRSYG